VGVHAKDVLAYTKNADKIYAMQDDAEITPADYGGVQRKQEKNKEVMHLL